uniref:Uncharacterized protein n=1 Tax=Arundo donax TaxID=35708 RepID=A0A0A8XS89_ARUDO
MKSPFSCKQHSYETPFPQPKDPIPPPPAPTRIES